MSNISGKRSSDPFVQRNRTICATMLDKMIRNISVKLF